MASLDGIEYRRAEGKDVFPLMQLYQLAAKDVMADPVLLNYRKLVNEILSPDSVWIVADNGGTLLAALSILLDKDNRLAKVSRLILHPEWSDSNLVLKQALPLLIHYLGEKGIEVVYTTTRNVSLTQQQFTMSLGFQMLGIFPNAQGADPLKLNGLTAYFFESILREHRQADHTLHPLVLPLFELVRKTCGLAPLPVAEAPAFDASAFTSLPGLEAVDASAFVAHRFERLKERRSLATFYPFHAPNALITDPAQRLEIFVKLVPEVRFAAILGERLDLPVNPAELYHEVALMLHSRGISFVEVICDAGDVMGIECMTRAGFIPCAYFPAFKRQGDMRRDYVVLARSFERVLGSSRESSSVHPQYLSFLQQYYRLDEEIHLQRLQPRV